MRKRDIFVFSHLIEVLAVSYIFPLKNRILTGTKPMITKLLEQEGLFIVKYTY